MSVAVPLSSSVQEISVVSPERLVIGTGNKGKIREIEKGLRGLLVREVLSARSMENFPDAPEVESDFKLQATAKAGFYARELGHDMQDMPTWYISDDSGLSVKFGEDLSKPAVLEKLKNDGIDLRNYALPDGSIVDFGNFPLTEDISADLLAADDFPGLATGRIARLFGRVQGIEDHEAASAFYSRIHQILNGPGKPVLTNFVSAISIATLPDPAGEPVVVGTYRADLSGLLLSPGKAGPNGFGYDNNFAPLVGNPDFLSYGQMQPHEKAKTSPRAAAISDARQDLQQRRFIVDHQGLKISINAAGLRDYFRDNISPSEDSGTLAQLLGKRQVTIAGKRIEFAIAPENVNLVAKLSTKAASRRYVIRDPQFLPAWGAKAFRMVPLIASNVHFMGLGMAKALTHMEVPCLHDPASRIQCAIKKEVPEDNLVKFILKNGTASAWITLGISGADEVSRLARIFGKVREGLEQKGSSFAQAGIHHVKVVVDSSNGHMQMALDRIKAVREFLTTFESQTGVAGLIMAGNTVTGEMVQVAVKAGADIAKIGHGNADVCRTEENTAFHRAMITTVAECAQAAREMDAYVFADGGGISDSGTANKLFAAGAAGVMSGSLFAGHPDNEVSRWHTDPKTGRNFMYYYGSASNFALAANHGGRAEHRPSEGTRRVVYMREETLSDRMQQWLAAVASGTSFNADKIQHVGANGPYWDFHDLARDPQFSYSP